MADIQVPDEARRFQSLPRLDALHAPSELELEGLLEAVALVCGAPTAMIGLLGHDEEYIVASHGWAGERRIPRTQSISAHVILQPDILEIADHRADARFAQARLVTGPSACCFYAGTPLRRSDGAPFGALCVVDGLPGRLDDKQRELMRQLAKTAACLLGHQNYADPSADSEAHHRTLSEAAADAIISVNAQQRIVHFNVAAERMLRCSVDEAIGQPIERFIPARFRAEHPTHVERFGQSASPPRAMHASGRLSGLRGDGTEFPIEASISQTQVAGAPMYTVILRDITERTELEKRELLRADELSAANRALQRVSERLAVAQRISHIGSWDLDLRDGLVTWSDELFRIVGLALSSSAPGLAEQEQCYTAESWTRLQDAVALSTASGHGYELKLTVVRPDGEQCLTVASAEALCGVSGRVERLVGTLQDITEQERVAGQLRLLTERLQLATTGARLGVWDWDVVTNTLVWDQTMYDLFDTPRDRFGGAYESWRATIHPDDLASAEADLNVSLAGSDDFQSAFRIVRSNGQIRYLRAAATVHRDRITGRAVRMVGLNWDVTDQRTAELALQSSEALQRAILSHAGSAIIATDTKGTITLFNREAEAMLGYPASELIGSATPILLHDPGELELRRIELEAELSVPIGLFEVLVVKPRLGKAESREWTYVRKDGARLPVLVTMSAARDDAGSIVGYLGLSVDLTEQKAHERALLELNQLLAERTSQAEAANRAKSQFLANMSHEIRTPMNGVLGMLHLALDGELPRELRNDLKTAQGSAVSLLEIIDDLLDLSKIESGKLELEELELSVSELLQRSVEVAALRAHEKRVELIVSVAAEVPARLHGDPVRLRQVLSNLVGNAVKFTERGHIQVSLEVALAEECGAPALVCSVSDTGIGIPSDRLQRVFEAFQQADGSTTRRHGGTGLGLTISRELVARMGGRLTLESTLGVGSRFRFAVPLRTAVARAGERSALLPCQPMLSGRRVLVIDDHPLSRSALSRMLGAHGAAVFTAESGAEALARVATDDAPFEAILIDHSLDGELGLLLGPRLRRTIAARDSRLILLRSGQRVDRAQLVEAGFELALDKPVMPAALALALGQPRADAKSLKRLSLPATTGRAPRLSALDVLMVEDHPVNAHFLGELLKRQGHRVVHAANGALALAVLVKQTFDVVLMDVQMPELDGLEATRRIRALERGTARHVPIVGLTANAMTGDRDQCLEAGMDHYLPKPVSPESLWRVLALAATGRTPLDVELVGVVPAAPATVLALPFSRAELARRTCDDPQFMREVIRIFLSTESALISDLAGAIASGVCADVRGAAHRLKGALEQLCAEPSADLARQIELAARQQVVDDTPELFVRLTRELGLLREALRASEQP